MIATLDVRLVFLRALAGTWFGRTRPVLTVSAFRGFELAGLLCAALFLHAVWPPLVYAAAAAVLLLLGQRK